MGDFYTEYELFLKLAEAFDRAYEFWITGTFAVIVACYLGKHLLDKTFAIALASLYTLFSANIFIRLYMGRESIGKVRNEIQRFDEFERFFVQSHIVQISFLFLVLTILLGFIGTLFFIWHSYKAIDDNPEATDDD